MRKAKVALRERSPAASRCHAKHSTTELTELWEGQERHQPFLGVGWAGVIFAFKAR